MPLPCLLCGRGLPIFNYMDPYVVSLLCKRVLRTSIIVDNMNHQQPPSQAHILHICNSSCIFCNALNCLQYHHPWQFLTCWTFQPLSIRAYLAFHLGLIAVFWVFSLSAVLPTTPSAVVSRFLAAGVASRTTRSTVLACRSMVLDELNDEFRIFEVCS